MAKQRIFDNGFKAGTKVEQERILKYLKGVLKSNPKASLGATIDLIEAEKPPTPLP